MTAADEHPDVTALRAFNRLYTHRMGLLNSRLDGSPFSLTEARILFELAHRREPAAAEIMRALNLDRAQLSRTLKRFSDRGLIETSAHPEGGRRRPITLTAEGRASFAALDRNTRRAVGGLLDGLPGDKRKRLIDAAKAIIGLFEERTTGKMLLRDLKPGDLGWVTHRQAILYAEEYGWNGEYEALVSRILGDFAQSFDPDHDAAWIAEIDGRVVGSVFLVRGDEPEVGKLRLLYVEPDARGAGVATRLVDACIERARQAGDARLVLWTNSVLTAARRVYERADFRLVEESPHHSFGKELVGQVWELDLTRREAV